MRNSKKKFKGEHDTNVKENDSKKSVTFDLKPEIILIKSYKGFNRTGKHQESCVCIIF